MTATLLEKAWNVAEVTVWCMENRVITLQARFHAAEGMEDRGTGTVEKLERSARSLAKAQAELDDIREVIDQFNVSIQETGLSEKEYDTRQRNLARKIIGYNKSYRQ